MTRVSFVTPTFNDDPAHLLQAIDSVRDQTHADVEHVIVDDGSTRTAGIDAARVAGVKVIGQRNGGPAAARNLGVRRSTGDILVFLDADDYVSPTFAAEAVEVLEDPRATIAYAAKRCFGAKDFFDPGDGDRELPRFLSSSGVPMCSALRRADFDAAGGFDGGLREGFEDTEFWLRLMLRRGGVARRMPSAVFHYRVREGSRSAVLGALAAQVTRERAIANAGDDLGRLTMALFDALDGEIATRRRVMADLSIRGRLRRLMRAKR